MASNALTKEQLLLRVQDLERLEALATLEKIRTNDEVATLGVQQGDLRPPNIPWNNELDRAILLDFEYAHVEEAHEKIGSAIAKKSEVKKKIKVLGQTSGNRASHQAVVQPVSKVCDGYLDYLVSSSLVFGLRHYNPSVCNFMAKNSISAKAIFLGSRHLCGFVF
ncbi:hypothetical protein MMC31_000680 [Peltigera leucophlebia]|nr:hypothetical protein [Peltigera leucophlebia]